MPHVRRMIVLAEGKFSPLESKTANQSIRYIPDEVVGVIDSTKDGLTAEQVLGYGGLIPVVPSLAAGFSLRPDTLLIGIAPTGGRLPESWRAIIREAISGGLHVISGLHTFLSEDAEFASLARQHNVTLTDLRRVPPEYEVVAKGSWKSRKSKVILTVGTDCNVGKMTLSLELHREFLRRGESSEFVPTGQTGILLEGKGIAVDSILSDYVAGSIEMEVDKCVARGTKFIHVEGQGSLTHQGYSAVTLGLIHGVMPDAMILVHHPARHRDNYGFCLDQVSKFIEIHEMIVSPFKRAMVVGIAINTAFMKDKEIRTAMKELSVETGLPVASTLMPGARVLVDSLLHYFSPRGL